MRGRSVVVILVAAAVLGVLTGRFVLPQPSASATPAERPGATASSSGDASPLPTPASGPMTDRHLLTAADFKKVGVSRRIHVRDRVGDGNYANAACTGEKTLAETLGSNDAHFRGLLTGKDTGYGDDPTTAADIDDQVAREVADDAGSRALAENFAQRLLLEEVPCQDEPATHWVYGPTHTIDITPAITASWMGAYDGDLNTTGTAPRGKEPCGGIAVLRNGTHYGVLEVQACLDTAAMTQIVRTAVIKL
ncbi:hypothetical protein SAMN06272735_4483 [Streptomyces sp. TLI_55]|uniref:hypothetical protein n=1 Tax=Streptomyces sp. TLI_55 TaxID=1938861 RepID=UPI000BCEA749|nr:hypothetical protein [Streptomyces sp. TLI_55]SNX62696.1 hypothetical protein SAMN06272735_4483 [Streptomyces sp. TLI_55]